MDKYKGKYKDLLQFVKDLQSEISTLQASASGTQLSPHVERIYNLISDKLNEKNKKKKRLSNPDTSANITSPRQLKNSSSSTPKEAINAEKSGTKSTDMRSSAQVAVPTVLLLGSPNSVKLKSVEDRVIPPISTTQVQSPKLRDSSNNEKSNQNTTNKDPATTQPVSTNETSQPKVEEKNVSKGVDSSTSSSAGTPLGTPGTSGNNTPVGSPSTASFFGTARPTSVLLSRSTSGDSSSDGQQDPTVQNKGGFVARQPSQSVVGERQNSGWSFSSRGRQERPAEVQIGAKTRTATSENVIPDIPAPSNVTPVTEDVNSTQQQDDEPKDQPQINSPTNNDNNANTELAEVAKESQQQSTDESIKVDQFESGDNDIMEISLKKTEIVTITSEIKKANTSNNNRNSLNLEPDFQSPFDDYNPLEETIIMPSTHAYNNEPNPMEDTIIMPSTASLNDEPNPMEETIVMPTSVDASSQFTPSTSPSSDNFNSPQLQPRYSVSFNSRKSISPGNAPRITLIGANRNRGDSGESTSPSDSPKQRSAAKTYSSDTLMSPKGENKIIKIYLPNRLMHSAYLPKDKVLKEVLQKLVETRSDLTDPNLVAKDLDGTPLDVNLTIGQLPNEMLFGGTKENETKSQESSDEEKAANRAKRKTFAPIKGLAKNLTLRGKKNRDSGSIDADSVSEVKAKSHLAQSALDAVTTTPRRKKSVLVDALVDLPKFQRRPDSSDMSSHSNVDSLIDRPASQNNSNNYSAPGTPEVPVAAAPKPKKFEKKIQYILEEIVKTEADYRNDLIKYMDIFKLPLRKEEIVTPEEEQQLFINIEDIVVLADQMTAMFDVMVDINSPDTCQVGEAFIQMLPQFDAYKQYCGAQQAANKLYANLMKNNKRFKKFIDMAKVQANLQDLASFLIKPLQRITKYPLLLNELLKELPQENLDVPKIIEAKTAIERLVNATNETKRVADAVEKIHTLDEQLNWDKYVSEGGEKIVLSDIMDRVSYIREGDLKLLSKSGEQKLFGLLFNSFLLVTKIDGDEYKVRYVVPMQNLYVWNLDPAEAPDAKFGFALVKSDSKFRLNLCGISEADKHDWMTKINQCIFIKFISYKK